MNYQNLEKEIKKYSEYFNHNQNTISKLSNYYKGVGKYGIKFINSLKQCLDEFNVEVLKGIGSTTYSKLLINIYNEKKSFIEKLRLFFTNIAINYGDKLAEYLSDYKRKSQELIVKFNLLNKGLKESKQQLDKWKEQYFDYCKSCLDLEHKIKPLLGQEEKKDLTNKLISQLNTNEEIKKIKKKNYKEEQTKLNKLLEFNEDTYIKITTSIENEDVERMQYISNFINNTNQNITGFIQDLNVYLNKINLLTKKLNAKNDWKTLRKEFDFSVEQDIGKNKRFILEEFLDYDTIKFSEDLTNRKNNMNNNKKLDRYKRILNMGKLYFTDLDNLTEEENDINKIIIKLISDENNINNDDFLRAIKYVENNIKHCGKFVDILATHFCEGKLILFKNYDNLNYLNNILIIILNFVFDYKNKLDICLIIIFIVEKAVFIGEGNPVYFFEIMSKKAFLESSSFWKDLIDTKINIVSQTDINKEYAKRMKNVVKKNSFFGLNDNIEGELMLKQIFNEKAGIYFLEVFYSFVKHFTHFNFYKQEEILNSFNSKYTIDKTVIDYFRLVIKSDNIYYKQNKSNKIINKSSNKILFDYKPNKSFKKIENKAIKCILFSLKYLSPNEYIKILCLSKKYTKHISRILYKQILLKKENMEIKAHLNIWKLLFNYKEIKEEYDYPKIIKSIKDQNKQIINEAIIQMDISRTYFSQNKEENKIKLGNILRAISDTFPKINYYQGMNQVAGFLLSLCDFNEEEAFYFFVSIIKHTEYCSIFEDNLARMNYLFYQFDRLLNLYLPGVYIFFNQSGINAGFFLSPWIITLCTNFFDDSNENKNTRNIMLILDMFFFSGVKNIIKCGIVLLKSLEKEILKNYSETLLPFLTGNLTKAEIIKGKNFEQFREEMLNIKYNITKELFDNIGEEFNIKKKISFFEEGNKISSAF